MENKNQHTEEEKLILLAKLNRKNFRALYEKYFDTIFYFIYHRTGNEELSADLTQQVFMSAMIHLPKYEFKGFPFSSWLYRIALNEVNQFYRKNKNKRHVEINEEDLGELSSEILESENEEIFSGEIVKELLNLLEPEELILVEMKYLEGKILVTKVPPSSKNFVADFNTIKESSTWLNASLHQVELIFGAASFKNTSTFQVLSSFLS